MTREIKGGRKPADCVGSVLPKEIIVYEQTLPNRHITAEQHTFAIYFWLLISRLDTNGRVLPQAP
ncbi:hypothetical protein JHL22_08910 [Advenella sp. WQ 585]|uniref:Uncharacterized protein n=1 Tax=Advenella mandrilli TaxID=2800330 RepID=A0ABS1EBP3_9BURK|nr:hypothetical protein [Advenella mandrilli]MBK1781337.1 hypothetical protein [Advenella mandrilli]MDY0273180.1 hypothetical protein [Advenella sp.]